MENYRLELMLGSAPDDEIERVQRDIDTLRGELQRSQIPTVSEVRDTLRRAGRRARPPLRLQPQGETAQGRAEQRRRGRRKGG